MGKDSSNSFEFAHGDTRDYVMLYLPEKDTCDDIR